MAKDYSYLKGNQYAKGHTPNNTAFGTGHIPWNKGMVGIHFSPDTEFQPGHKRNLELAEGSITVRRTKGGKRRRFIKTREGWTEYAKWLWKQTFGCLIKGDIVHHLNGDVLDDRIENLIAMPRSHHPAFHGRWGLYTIDNASLTFYRQRYT